MDEIHSLLKRQLRKHFGGTDRIPDETREFIQAVDAAYNGFNDDRTMLERSLELSSLELLKANSEMRAVLEAVPDVFFRLKKDGTIIDYKTARTEILYMAPEDFLGKRIQEVTPQHIGRKFDKAILQINEKKRVVTIEYPLKMPKGEYWFEARILALPDDHIFAIIRNITTRIRADKERRELEAQVQHTQKLESIGLLAGGIAHDFNNLLTGILGNADVALNQLPATSTTRSQLEAIKQASKRAAELCNQMLAYSGKGTFIEEIIDINQLIQEMTHLLDVSISKKIAMKYALAADLPAVNCDVGQLRQVVMNLIMNASDAIGNEIGVISLRTELIKVDREYLANAYTGTDISLGHYIVVEVSDTGCGMNENTMQKMFDPFYTTKCNGHGLGLSAVLGIVRAHHGTVKLNSVLEEGTTFTVLLPCNDLELTVPAKKQVKFDSKWKPAGGTVLIVDDEDLICDVVTSMLTPLGFSVCQASDGAEGVEIFREKSDEIVAVLLDMTMPNMDGTEAFEHMHKIRSDIPVILASGYTEKDVMRDCIDSGIAAFIHKPYERATLINQLRQILDK